jgi:nucleotide-binding universal stress UspA family protein
MAHRDLLVHLRRHEGLPVVAESALRLGKVLDAHLTGLFVSALAPAAFAAPEAIAMEVLDAERGFAAAEQAAPWWRQLLTEFGVRGEWRVAQGDPVDAICRAATLADLVLLERPTLHPEAPLGWGVVSRTVFGCGAPVLVVPEGVRGPALGQGVLVAWNGSREAARALRGALPILAQAARIVVLRGAPEDRGLAARRLPGPDLGAWLERHGLEVELRPFTPGSDAGTAILAAAHEANADLVVMGAWGHSRLTELILGGATRWLFAHSDIAMLVAH